MNPEAGTSDVSEIVEGASNKGLGAAVNKDDAMQLCCRAD